MAAYRFSKLARDDLRDLTRYTQRVWGAKQALLYSTRIRECCQRLAELPLSGRACAEISPDLRRMEEGKHVIFYTAKAYGIFVSRILHQQVLAEKDGSERIIRFPVSGCG